MGYLTREIILNVLRRMRCFHQEIAALHGRYGIDFLQNLGRRNIVISHAQERFLADELAKYYDGVVADGRSGHPDILLGSLDRELECKLTTANLQTGSVAFQTDFETLRQKSGLDYLYIIADAPFEQFCVLYFENLTADDFREPHSTARGKASMVKHLGMDKCTVLFGNVKTQNHATLESLSSQLLQNESAYRLSCQEARNKVEMLEAVWKRDKTERHLTSSKRQLVKQQLARAKERPAFLASRRSKRKAAILREIGQVVEKTPRYSFLLEKLEDSSTDA